MEVILIILAIFAALSGLFQDKSGSGKGGGAPSRPTPDPVPSGGSSDESSRNAYDNKSEDFDNPTSIEEKQNEQRKQLAERMNAGGESDTQEHNHDALENHTVREPGGDLTTEQKKMKRRINQNLNRDGLVNGIIMSEVLGQPRAKKPYQSIIAQRKNK